MRSATRLAVAVDASRTTRVAELRAEVPQLVRVTDRGGPHRALVAHLVGGAAGPLGGDGAAFELCLAPASRLTVRSVAATLAHPGAAGLPSQAVLRADVGDDAELDWWPEPMIAVAGCDHRLTVHVELAATARLRWVDELVAGRAGEASGAVTVHQRVTWRGRPVLDHQVRIGPDAAGAGWHGAARAVLTAVEIGGPPRAAATVVEDGCSAMCASPEPGVTVYAGLGASVTAGRAGAARLGLVRTNS